MSEPQALVTIHAGPDDHPEIRDNRIRLGNVEISFDINADKGASWCREFGLALLTQAEALDVETKVDEQALLSVHALIADIKREKGHIADDGWCWECKADRHDSHRDYTFDACVGCSCDWRPKPTPTAECIPTETQEIR